MKKILSILVLVSMFMMVLASCNSMPSAVFAEKEKYNHALSLLAEEKYEEAYVILSEINTYVPAQEKLKNFFYAPQTVTESWKYSDSADYRTDSINYSYDLMGNIIETSDGEMFTYDSDGNILSGRDLVFGTYYTYAYKNGKLYQRKSSDTTETYCYNSNGLISEVIYENSNGARGQLFNYTYYNNGTVKTRSDGYSYNEYIYDETGKLTRVEIYISDEPYASITIAYGKYGKSAMTLQSVDGETATFTYSYDARGRLTTLEVKSSEEGFLSSLHKYEFTNHQLCYSENPSVLDRIAVVCYTDIDAAIEIIW